MGLVSPRGVGVTEWLLRIGCRPGGARRLADALARREDVSWVTLSSGGSEIVCVVRSLSEQQSDELLLQRLPATSQVLSLATHAVLHRFAGREADWAGYVGDLTEAQATRLATAAEAGRAAPIRTCSSRRTRHCWPRWPWTGGRATPRWPRRPAGPRAG